MNSGIGKASQEVYLPPNLSLTDPRGQVWLRVAQSRCRSGWTFSDPIHISQPGQHGPPQVRRKVHSCTRYIRVEGAHAGASPPQQRRRCL